MGSEGDAFRVRLGDIPPRPGAGGGQAGRGQHPGRGPQLTDRRPELADRFGIGWLGEIPAGAVLGAGMVLWGAGDTLDTTVDWAEGRIGGRELAFRAGFAVATAFAGGLAVKFGGKVLDKLAPRVAEKLRRLIDDVVKPGLVDERGSVGVPGGGRLSDVDHSAVRGLVDRVASAATREQALDLARTFEVAPKRFRDLATDPDRGGVITRNGAEEAAAVLGAERRGLLPEGMVRSSRPGADYAVRASAVAVAWSRWWCSASSTPAWTTPWNGVRTPTPSTGWCARPNGRARTRRWPLGVDPGWLKSGRSRCWPTGARARARLPGDLSR